MIDDVTPSIYVACLAAYNNGYLHGAWIEVTQDVNAIYNKIQEILATSPIPNAEEWEIHDHEGFGSLNIHEYSDIEYIHKIAQFILEQEGELGAAIIEHYGDLKTAEAALTDFYHGAWKSELDFATELFDEIYLNDIPEHIRFYVDYKQFQYDLFINDYFSLKANGSIHVFSNH